MDKLTLDKLKSMDPETIFSSGVTEIDHPWEVGNKVTVKWVAVRGGIHDWAIYHSFDSNIVVAWGEHTKASDRYIAQMGSKLHDLNKIKELVACDKEALEMYRH